MKKIKRFINTFDPKLIAFLMLKNFTIGDIRDEQDFKLIKQYCARSLTFTLDIIKNTEGTKAQLNKFLNDVYSELNKFYINDNELKDKNNKTN